MWHHATGMALSLQPPVAAQEPLATSSITFILQTVCVCVCKRGGGGSHGHRVGTQHP